MHDEALAHQLSCHIHFSCLCSGVCLISAFALFQGADVDACERFGRTALHLAADGNRVEAVQALLGCGADVNAEDLRRDMALHYGAADNSADLVQLLVRSGARINGRGGECSCSRSSPQLPQRRTFLHLVFRPD